MLKTKSIKTQPRPEDGVRISVMSRHTLNDGQTPDPEITDELWDEWQPGLAPPLNLVGSYYRGETNWPQFEAEYLAHIRQSEIIRAVGGLARRASKTDITLLCVEASPEHCHRRLLAEECQRLGDGLEVDIG